MITPVLTLPSGRVLRLDRLRSDGVLDREALEYCREHSIPLGYDCVQIGWVPMAAVDDIAGALAHASPDVAAVEPPDQVIETLRAQLASEIAGVLLELRSHTQSLQEARLRVLSIIDVMETRLPSTDLRVLDRCHTLLMHDATNALALDERGQVPPRDSRFGFRSWQPADLSTYMRIVGNQAAWTYLPDRFPHPFDETVAESLLEMSRTGSHHEVRAVEYEGQIVGQVRLLFNGSYPGLRGAEIAYLLGEEFWGRGLMSQILVDYTYRSLQAHDLHFIDAWIHPDNHASVATAIKAGYHRDHFTGEEGLSRLVRRSGFLRYRRFRCEAIGAGR